MFYLNKLSQTMKHAPSHTEPSLLYPFPFLFLSLSLSYFLSLISVPFLLPPFLPPEFRKVAYRK